MFMWWRWFTPAVDVAHVIKSYGSYLECIIIANYIRCSAAGDVKRTSDVGGVYI